MSQYATLDASIPTKRISCSKLQKINTNGSLLHFFIFRLVLPHGDGKTSVLIRPCIKRKKLLFLYVYVLICSSFICVLSTSIKNERFSLNERRVKQKGLIFL